MAFGPATPLLQQAILTLMQGQKPSPLAPETLPPASTPVISAPIPTGGFSPPGGFAMPPTAPPEPAPVAPPPALDTALIEQLTGPRPVAPPIEPTPLIIRIARALQGFGAGTQGQGPQFLAQLEEERQRPQREFRAATEAFESRRGRAVEIAEEKRQREQAAIQRRADEQSEREFRQWVQRTGVQDSMALEQLRQTFEMERDARRMAEERTKEERQERTRKETEARQFSNQFFTASKNRALSNELGRYYAGLTDKLTPAAARLDRRLAQAGEVRTSRSIGAALGGGRTGGASNAAMKAYDDFNAALQAVIAATQRGDVRAERQHRARLDRAFGALSRFPGQIEAGIGTGGWPYAKLRNAPAPAAAPGSQPQPQEPQAPAPDPLGIR